MYLSEEEKWVAEIGSALPTFKGSRRFLFLLSITWLHRRRAALWERPANIYLSNGTISQSQNSTWEWLQVTHESLLIQTEWGKDFSFLLRDIRCRAKAKIWEWRGWRAYYTPPSEKGQHTSNTEASHRKTKLSAGPSKEQRQLCS